MIVFGDGLFIILTQNRHCLRLRSRRSPLLMSGRLQKLVDTDVSPKTRPAVQSWHQNE